MYINIHANTDFYKFFTFHHLCQPKYWNYFCTLDNCVKASTAIKVSLKIKRTHLFNTETHTTFTLVSSLSSTWTVFHLENNTLMWSAALYSVSSNVILWIIYFLLKPCFWTSTLTAWIRVNCHLSSEPKPAADSQKQCISILILPYEEKSLKYISSFSDAGKRKQWP